MLVKYIGTETFKNSKKKGGSMLVLKTTYASKNGGIII